MKNFHHTVAPCLLAAVLMLGASTAGAANILIVNLDSAGEGFNDNTAVAPIGGNPGTTIGAQRLNVFQAAADIWGQLLPGSVTIRVNSNFDALTCDAVSAVLGSAGTNTVHRDFSGSEFAGTWYHAALANRQAGVDLDLSNAEIRARFNSAIDNNANCLGNSNWYYGLDGNEGSDVELLPVVLHEIAHGLGFSEFVDASTGELFNGNIDVYSRFLRDDTNGLLWSQMSNGQRAASAINAGNVVWDGFAVNFRAQIDLDGLPTIEITAPPVIAGTITEVGTASFGPSVSAQMAVGDIVLFDDGVGTNSDGCEAAVSANAAALNGNIALIDRGDCAFTTKALNAEAAGAVGVIIVNNLPGDGAIQLGGTDPGLTIPTLSISFEQGAILKAQLPGVSGAMQPDPNQLAGTSAGSGKVLVYTPNPLESGSSVSHWDISAEPNLLMEPAINGNLSSSVDLTREHFEDIGWFLTRVTDAPASVAKTLLRGNTPNPFNPMTTIEFELSRSTEVALTVYDAAGRKVKQLVDGTRAAGQHDVQWDGTDASGHKVASGVYHYRLQADGVDLTRPMVLLK